MADRPVPEVSRRAVLRGAGAVGAVLLGVGASGGLLAGCGSSSSSGRASSSSGDATSSAKPGTPGALIAFFGGENTIRPGIPQRLTFGLGDSQGVLVKDAPKTVTFTILDDQGKVVAPATAVAAHAVGLPRAYYPVEVTAPRAGTYTARATFGSTHLDAAFSVDEAANVKVPQVGDQLPALQTPTTTDHRGVDPICTHVPPCDLHTQTPASARAAHKPVALIISTPAFCQVAICGPVLDLVLDAQKRYGDRIDFVHAEVYASGAEAAENISSAQLSPTVKALGLTFEPCLFLAKADGTLEGRLDAIFDAVELSNALDRLAA